MANKVSDFKIRVLANQPDVIAICETWFQDDPFNDKFYPDECLILPGYNKYRYDNTGALKGGIILYIKPKLDGGVCKEMSDAVLNIEECAWHWIKINTEDKLLFGCFYRKGSSVPRNNKLINEAITKAHNLSDLITVCGDFNYPTIPWGYCMETSDTPTAEEDFMDTLDDLVLVQHVKSFTRKRGTDNPSLLDLVITDDNQTISNLNIKEPFGKSDHSLVSWNSTFKVIDFYEDHQKAVPKPNYYKGNYCQMRKDLSMIDWDQEFNLCKDVHSMIKKFEDIIDQKVKEHVPLKKRNNRNNGSHVPWVDYRTSKAIKRKYHAWKRYTNTKSHEQYLQYIKERNKVSKKIRKAKREFEKNIAKECKVNPKAFFNYVNSHKRKSTNFIRIKKASEEYTTDDQDTAEELNGYFKSVFTVNKDSAELDFEKLYQDLTNKSKNQHSENPSTTKLSSIEITIDEVHALLSKVNSNKSAGDDNIHPRVLRECALELASPLHRIFQESVNSGCVPHSWKTATITPIFKSDDRSLPENYRPISITSQVGKLLEKILRMKMLDHLMDNGLLSKNQHGFCNKRSCMTNLMETLDYITEMNDIGIPVDEIFLDFSKAFDKVSHKHLLNKLYYMGIDGKALQWIFNFLVGRKQRVSVNGSHSSYTSVTSGVPQGSVLGPLLFVIFINDLPEHIRSHCKLFADDSKVYSKVGTDEDQVKLQLDLDACHNWAVRNDMQFHPKKCKVMHIGSNNCRDIYHLGNNIIDEAIEEKDLGITVTNNLSWGNHIVNIAKKANRVLGMIRHTFSYMDRDMFLMLYKTLVRPQMEYCQEIWSPYLKRDIAVLEKVQRRATKIVPDLQDLPYETRLKELKLYPLSERRARGDMITVFKMFNGLIDADVERLMPLKVGMGSTRSHNMQIQCNIPNNNARKYFFTQRIVFPWNTLSSDTVNSLTVNEFKGKYDRERLGMYL